jgi:hypothetical protein
MARAATALLLRRLTQRGSPQKLQNLRDTRAHEAENDRRSQWDKNLAPKNLEPNIARQTPKAQLLQPRRDRVDEQQGQENNNEPTGHTAAYSA